MSDGRQISIISVPRDQWDAGYAQLDNEALAAELLRVARLDRQPGPTRVDVFETVDRVAFRLWELA